jgi:hypothetical protein
MCSLLSQFVVGSRISQPKNVTQIGTDICDTDDDGTEVNSLIATEREFKAVGEFAEGRVQEGLEVLIWYGPGNTPGWYRRIVAMYDKVTKKHQINICDVTFDHVRLERRGYDSTGTWLSGIPKTVVPTLLRLTILVVYPS